MCFSQSISWYDFAFSTAFTLALDFLIISDLTFRLYLLLISFSVVFRRSSPTNFSTKLSSCSSKVCNILLLSMQLTDTEPSSWVNSFSCKSGSPQDSNSFSSCLRGQKSFSSLFVASLTMSFFTPNFSQTSPFHVCWRVQ